VTIKLLCENDTAVLTLFGDIDMPEVVNIRNTISSLFQHGCYRIVLDLVRVGHINATGLGILADSLHRARICKGDIKLSSLNVYLQNIFELTEMDKIFQIYPDRDSALEGFKSVKVAAA
jgi:anti-sigma B factor antagonist